MFFWARRNNFFTPHMSGCETPRITDKMKELKQSGMSDRQLFRLKEMVAWFYQVKEIERSQSVEKLFSNLKQLKLKLPSTRNAESWTSLRMWLEAKPAGLYTAEWKKLLRVEQYPLKYKGQKEVRSQESKIFVESPQLVDDSFQCLVCFERPVEYISAPCGHLQCCHQCFPKEEARKKTSCWTCKQPRTWLKIYPL